MIAVFSRIDLASGNLQILKVLEGASGLIKENFFGGTKDFEMFALSNQPGGRY